MNEVTNRLDALETELKGAQADAIEGIQEEAATAAQAANKSAAATQEELLASVAHLKALDKAAILRLTCIGASHGQIPSLG